MTPVYEMLNFYQEQDPAKRQPINLKKLALDNQELHIKYDTIYYGLVSHNSLSKEKAQGLLSDVS